MCESQNDDEHVDGICNNTARNDGTSSTDSVSYYETHAEEYAAATLNADISALYEQFERYLKHGCRILDLGCGSGRDSRYFAGRGYEVIAADPSPRMCRIAKANANANADTNACISVYTMRAEELPFEDEFDAVWACASLLHVSRENQPLVMQRISRALKPGGILYASWKYGTQERIADGRTFTDMDEAGLQASLEHVPELKLIKSWISADVRPDQHEQRWLNALLRKQILLKKQIQHIIFHYNTDIQDAFPCTSQHHEP